MKMTVEEVKAMIKLRWEMLNEIGIYTMEDVDRAYEELPPLDISAMVAPLKKDEEE